MPGMPAPLRRKAGQAAALLSGATGHRIDSPGEAEQGNRLRTTHHGRHGESVLEPDLPKDWGLQPNRACGLGGHSARQPMNVSLSLKLQAMFIWLWNGWVDIRIWRFRLLRAGKGEYWNLQWRL